MNTHYGVLVFDGDFDNDHPDENLRGHGPTMTIIAAGPEERCWEALRLWTQNHPLQRDQQVEVLTRDPRLVADQYSAAGLP